jgi:hypothetical protein
MAGLEPLIAYLIDQVKEQGGTPNKTALVKLVYLLDVECWRKFGRPATDLEWKFHHYGPYSAEMERDIDDNAFVRVFGNRRSGYAFSPSSDWRDIHAAFNSQFGPRVRRVADEVVRRWSLEPLETLLEYVYFETEPMQNARRGETLDFSMIQIEETPTSKSPSLVFSDDFISSIRARWDRRPKTTGASSQDQKTPEPIHDEVYEEALKLMAEEEGLTPGASPRRHRLQGPNQRRLT